MLKLGTTYLNAFRNTRKGTQEFLAIIVPVFRPMQRSFLIVFLFLVVGVFSDSLYPLLYGKLTDALIAHEGTLAIIMLVALFAQSMIRSVIDFLRQRYEVEHIDWEVGLRIMNESLERICGFSMAQCASAHTGKTREIIRNGRNAMRQLLYVAIYHMGPTLLRLLMALVALLWFCLPIGAIALLGTLIYLGFAMWLFMRYRAPLKVLENRSNENSKLFADILANMEVVLAYAQQRHTAEDFNADGQELARQGKTFWREALRWFYVRNSIALVFRNLIMAFTAYLLFGNVFTFGLFVALTQWAMQAVAATQELGQMQHEISRNWAHVELYLQLLNQKPDITMISDPVPVERLRGDIRFQNVTFTYEPRAKDDPLEPAEPVVALDQVSFNIFPGQKVALVGESGAGKSTIAYALMRARDPQSGCITIDGTDLRNIELNMLRRRIGYVPQHPRLFDSTLRYNLAYGLHDQSQATDEKLHHVLRLVKLEKIAEHGGLDSRLGEGGHTLSGGERQRLCIARALIKDPDVLIFDEATSSLDPVNEKRVQEAIDAVEGRTKIIIAHRYSTIRHVDRILVFDNGTLRDDGTHNELVRRSECYRSLLEQQGLL